MYSVAKSLLCSLVAVLVFAARGVDGDDKKNVLFIVADDLRPEINFLYNQAVSAGDSTEMFPSMVTPNMDALASKSIVFTRAYVQLPQCGPSRASFLVGRRPDTTRVYDLVTYWRDAAGNFTTIPQYFKDNNYTTSGIGKIFHQGDASGNDDDAYSWTETYFHGTANFESKDESWRSITDTQLSRRDLIDKQLADEAIAQLGDFADDFTNNNKTFFMALGFRKPHLPFVFPASVLDNYNESDVWVPSNDYVPTDMPAIAWKNWGELRGYQDITDTNATGDMNDTLADDKVRELRLAYYAAVSYVDEQLGRVLAELTAQGLENDTIVSFIGDHGFMLGEHGGFCKETMFELATHTPMMIHIPAVTNSGIITNQLVEFVDLFPTLAEAAGLTTPSQCADNSTFDLDCTEGLSLLPLVDDPDVALKKAAFSQQPRGNNMGYSIRTAEYRYTEWVNFDSVNYGPDWSDVTGTELYDLTLDLAENTNVEGDSGYATIKSYLQATLHDGWRNAIV